VTWVCSYDEILFDLAVWDPEVRGSVSERILQSRNVCVLTKIIRGKIRSSGFGSNFCPVEVTQRPKASVHQYNNTLLARRERCGSAWGSSATSCSLRGGTAQRNQQGLPRPHQVCGGGHPKTRFQTTTLPVKSHTELIGPITWHLKQCVDMHLFRTGMAFKFDRLCLCLPAWAFPTLLRIPRASASFATGRPSTYTTTEQILYRWGQVHRHSVSMRQWWPATCHVVGSLLARL